jgi:hypothetical protein
LRKSAKWPLISRSCTKKSACYKNIATTRAPAAEIHGEALTPLLVSAFFDIGRGNWQSFKRSANFYADCYAGYPARLPAPRYLLTTEEHRSLVQDVDYLDVAAPSELKAFDYLERTRAAMAAERFKALFRVDGKPEPTNPEYKVPEYNIVMIAKWDAFERAYARFGDRFSHYVWVDFGLGRRVAKRPYLPKPKGLSPIDRDRIVLSADREGGLRDLEPHTIEEYVRTFRDQIAGSAMVVPTRLVTEYSALVRSSYELLLDCGIPSDDQVVVDVCVRRRPELFHLSFPPLGLSKYNHIHNVLNGLDGETTPERNGWLRTTFARPLARAKIGLPMELRLR